MFKNNRLLVSLVSAIVLLGLLTGVAGAVELPPRPNPPSSPPSGASIELVITTNSLSWFTVVQWQDSNGSWHNVDTWMGTMDEFITNSNPLTAYKRWWVYPSDYGKQNFRWQVFDKPNGTLLATSDTFDFPTHGGQDVISTVTLP